VLRLSGPQAGWALARLAGGLPPPRVARRRRLADLDTGVRLDDALVLWFPAPASYTGEDVAELHVHGSRAVLAALADALFRLGLRQAEPGEFSRRAFEHGKLDLTQAEAVADLAAAETEAQRRQALRQLDGELGRIYRDWAERLTRTLAHLEALIDFPDEDLPPALERRIACDIAALARAIRAHLADDRRGERLREGIMVAILGPPNAGKSSLLNRIARREAAITSPYPGTTRDIVEVAIDLQGWPVVLADTAGLRDTADPVEAEGLRRARARAAEAEIRLFVYDALDPTAAAGASAWPSPDTILVANKIDLLPAADLLVVGDDCGGRVKNPLPPPGGEGRVRGAPPCAAAVAGVSEPSAVSGGREDGGVGKSAAVELDATASPTSPLPSPPPGAQRDTRLAVDTTSHPAFVVPGLDPGIHALASHEEKDTDGRVKPGHDVEKSRDAGQQSWFAVSALTGEGLDVLLQALAARIAANYSREAPALTRARHRAALEDASTALDRARKADLPELRAEDLRLALRSLGRVTGNVDVEDLLDVIFRDFCLGK
jgi:tRNA modification GTPase